MQLAEVRIVLVEDDPDAAFMLSALLEPEAASVAVARNKSQFWTLVSNREVDLIILDIGLPDGSGLDIIRRIRETSEVAIIVTSGYSSEADIVTAVEMGADDYLSKPFHARELIAKAKRLLSRTRGATYATNMVVSRDAPVYHFGEWSLDTGSFQLSHVSQGVQRLTTAEFRVLEALLKTRRRVLSRAQLMSHLHTGNAVSDERNIDGIISRLRKKLSRPAGFRPIETVRGAGYIFACEVSTESPPRD